MVAPLFTPFIPLYPTRFPFALPFYPFLLPCQDLIPPCLLPCICPLYLLLLCPSCPFDFPFTPHMVLMVLGWFLPLPLPATFAPFVFVTFVVILFTGSLLLFIRCPFTRATFTFLYGSRLPLPHTPFALPTHCLPYTPHTTTHGSYLWLILPYLSSFTLPLPILFWFTPFPYHTHIFTVLILLFYFIYLLLYCTYCCYHYYPLFDACCLTIYLHLLLYTIFYRLPYIYLLPLTTYLLLVLVVHMYTCTWFLHGVLECEIGNSHQIYSPI